MHNLTTEQIMTMCDKLSYKYKAGQEREDLVQEGLLAVYEVLHVEPDAHPAKLFRHADRAMWDYLNFSPLPVTIPITSASRDAMRGGEFDNSQTYSEAGEMALREAVAYVGVEYDDDTISTPSHADFYEDLEYEAYISTKVVTVLDAEELDVIKFRYYEGLTQKETSEALMVSQSTVSRREEEALRKIRSSL